MWSHLSLRADEVWHTSQDPPSRSRFQQLSDSDDLDVANSTLEDTTVLALFDRLVFHAETGEMLDSDSSLLDHSDEEEWSSDDDSMDSMFGYGVRMVGYGDGMVGYGDGMPWVDYDGMDDVSEVESNSSFLESMFGPSWAPPGWSDDVSSSSDDDTPPPTKKPPAKRPPTKKPPAKRPPTKKPPAKRPPTKKPPTKRPPIKKPPADTQAGPSKRLTRSATKQNLNTNKTTKGKKTKQNPLNNANIGEPSNRGKRTTQKQPTLEHNSGGSSLRTTQAKPKQPAKAHDTSASTSQDNGHSSTTTTSKGKESSSGRPRVVKTPAAQGQGPSATEQPIRSRRKQ